MPVANSQKPIVASPSFSIGAGFFHADFFDGAGSDFDADAGFGSTGFVSAGLVSAGFAGFAIGVELLFESVL